MSGKVKSIGATHSARRIARQTFPPTSAMCSACNYMIVLKQNVPFLSANRSGYMYLDGFSGCVLPREFSLSA